MYKNVLESIGGVEIFPIISLILFISVFTAMLVWVIRKDKGYINQMAAMPLNDTYAPTDPLNS